MIKSQLELHQKEFVRLEATSTSTINELTMALEAEREKVGVVVTRG